MSNLMLYWIDRLSQGTWNSWNMNSQIIMNPTTNSRCTCHQRCVCMAADVWIRCTRNKNARHVRRWISISLNMMLGCRGTGRGTCSIIKTYDSHLASAHVQLRRKINTWENGCKTCVYNDIIYCTSNQVCEVVWCKPPLIANDLQPQVGSHLDELKWVSHLESLQRQVAACGHRTAHWHWHWLCPCGFFFRYENGICSSAYRLKGFERRFLARFWLNPDWKNNGATNTAQVDELYQENLKCPVILGGFRY